MSRDLTQGPVAKKLILFAVPMLLSNLIMQLYNVADSVIVGQFVGPDAIAAVGTSFPIMMFFSAVFFGVSGGTGIVVSQFFGAKNEDGLRKVVDTAFTLTLIIGLAITALGLLFSESILHLLKTPDNILANARAYLMIIFGGMVGNLVYIIGSGILRGLGDSKWPLYFLIFSSVINVVLDLIFVAVFGWGVPGVAWATMIAHFLSGILVFFRINRGGYGIRLSFKSLTIHKHSAGMILKLGLPSGMQMMMMSIGSMIIQSFANGFGSTFIAANSIIMRADGFVVLPMMGLGMALTTFVGQNIGAGQIDRVKHGIFTAIRIIVVLGLGMGILLWFFGIFIMRAFTDDPTVLEIGLRGIRILAFFYVFMGTDYCLGAAMRGAGAAIAPMITSMTSNIIRIPVAYVLAVMPNNYMGLFYSMAISMVLGASMISVYYFKGNWRSKSIAKTPEKNPTPVE